LFVSALAANDGPTGPIQISKKLIDSPLDDIQWADSQTVFVLSELGVLYRSVDGGKAWTNQATKLHSANTNPAVRSMHISKADPNKIFLIGHGKENWASDDMGNKYSATAELDLYEVRLHPVQSNWILGASMSPGCQNDPKTDCYKVLYLSKDFGQTWEHKTDYIVQFDWAPSKKAVKGPKTRLHADVLANPYKNPEPEHDDDLVYATVHTLKHGNQIFGVWDKNIHFFQTWDYFHTQPKMVIQYGNRFLFGEHQYLFVAAVNPNHETEVSLQVSTDQGVDKVFKTAVLPVELTEHSYTILDTSEGTVFLHVNHAPFDQNAPTGHVYISDWSGTSYSLSLPYNHRSADGKCDFEKVEGLEGIYLANFIDDSDVGKDGQVKENWDETQSGGSTGAGRKKLKAKTVITFDKGGIWSYLEPPAVDIHGKAPCANHGGKDCHLHLHGITDLYGPFYSSATATGLIMATGTVGSFLQESSDQINTYLSRDAGLTWFEVAKGSHIYEFGDHGGLIVMAYDEGSTDSVMYSWDQGISWKTLKISDTPIQVENIIIEPEAVSTHFVVYGWQDDSVGVMIYIDFAELHEMRTCSGHDAADSASSDYETWSPSDGRLGGKCLMGHRVSYTRRKRASQCFNPEDHEREQFIENCPCTAEDFECDYGYKRKIEGGECVPDPDAKPLPAEKCHDFYYVSKGYRRVSGDTCTNGAQWDRVQVPCSILSSSHFGTILLVLLAFIVIALGVATFYGKLECVEDAVDFLKAKLRPSEYTLVGKKLPHSMADDDFGLDDQEYGQSAQLIRDDEDAHEKELEDAAASRLAGAASAPAGSKKKGGKKGKGNTASNPAEPVTKDLINMEDFNPRANH